MKKEELSKIKNSLKVDKHNYNILDFVSYYCKRSGSKLSKVGKQKINFQFEDDDVKEILLNNCKKIVSGAFGSKMFNLEIPSSVDGDNVMNYLINSLSESEFELMMDDFLEDVLNTVEYPDDVVINSALIEVNFKTKTAGVVNHRYISFSVNPIKVCEKYALLKTPYKNVSLNNTEFVVDYSNPIDGFIYPSMQDFNRNVNEIVYYTGKANALNKPLIEEILKCNTPLTSKEEKNLFSSVLKESFGDKVSLPNISNIINNISEQKVGNEEETITVKKLAEILKSNGIKDADDKLKAIITDSNTEVKIDNLIPAKNKGFKLTNNELTLSLNSTYINNVSKMNKSGKNCLLIELNDDVMLDDFKII